MVADEPGRAGDVEAEKVGGEAVEARTGAKAVRSGSEGKAGRETQGNGVQYHHVSSNAKIEFSFSAASTTHHAS